MENSKKEKSVERLPRKQFARVARVLAEPRRVEILKQIAANGGAMPCGELLKLHNITSQTMSHHTHELEGCGLIEIMREGRQGILHLQRDVLKSYIAEFAEI